MRPAKLFRAAGRINTACSDCRLFVRGCSFACRLHQHGNPKAVEKSCLIKQPQQTLLPYKMFLLFHSTIGFFIDRKDKMTSQKTEVTGVELLKRVVDDALFGGFNQEAVVNQCLQMAESMPGMAATTAVLLTLAQKKLPDQEIISQARTEIKQSKAA